MKWTQQFPAVRMCSVIIFLIAMLACIGHLEHNAKLYSWYGEGVMSFPTSICFMVSSWALFILGLERGQHAKAHDDANH